MMIEVIRTSGALLAAAGLVAALSACESPMNDPRLHSVDYKRDHPTTVTSRFVTMPFEVSPDGRSLNQAAARKLDEFVDFYLKSGSGMLEVALPLGSGGRVAASARAGLIRARALRRGVRPDEVAVRFTEISGEGPVVVSYEQFVAAPSPCGYTTTNMAYNPRNTQFETYGCVTQHNMASMISNPADLIRAQRESPNESQRRNDAIRALREGGDPSSETGIEPGSAAETR